MAHLSSVEVTEPSVSISETVPTSTHESCIKLNSMLDLLKDDVYKSLADHFLRTHKGRKPKLPDIPTLTNGVLLQLNLIKEEGQFSFRELKTWVDKLFTDTATVTESRMTHRITSLLKQIEQGAEASLFLEEADFHGLPTALSNLGLSRLHLTGTKEFHGRQNSTISITNDVVIKLDKFRNNERLPPVFVRKWVKVLCAPLCTNLTDSKVRSKVEKVLKHQKNLSNRKKHAELELFLSKPFLEEEVCEPGQQSCGDCKTLKSELNKKETVIETLKKEQSILHEQLAVNTDIICEKDELIAAKNCNEQQITDLKKQLKESEKSRESLIEEREVCKKSKLYKHNFSLKRRVSELNEERDKIEKDLVDEQNQTSHLAKSLQECKAKLKKVQTLNSKHKSSLHAERSKNSELREMLTYDDNMTVKLREEGSSHRYTDEVRKTFYALQGESSVAAGNCSKVIETVAKHLFNVDISEEQLPCASTSINFSHEANVIAKHHAMSEILKADHFTYASDGTSRQKAHFLEQHIILSTGKQMSLGFSEIASDDSETLLEKCVSIFQDLCEVYTLDDEDVDGNELLKDVIRKMTCLLSDRAAVMKAFNSKMSNYKDELLKGEDCSTLFLFCNAHFLLALSSAAENAVQIFEKEAIDQGGKLGRDSSAKFASFSTAKESAAIRLIRLAAEVLGPRPDEKSGCRREWLSFCSSRGVQSAFSSFRNNRFNNLFQNASALLRHRHDIKKFLDDYVSHSNLKLQSVLADLDDDRIMAVISVLSFLHICITEPYWQLMNSTTKSYADFSYYVKKMKALFDLWGSPKFQPVSQSVESVFGDEFAASQSDISVLKHFLDTEPFNVPAFMSCFRSICKECTNAITRQLSDFLEGGVFGSELDEEVRKILKTCPLHNLTGERLFGDLDYDMNKRRNASLILRSTNVMLKHNKSVKWLSEQSPSMTKKLIERAIKYGPEWKAKSIREKKAVDEKIQERIAENKRKKDEKILKAAERRCAALDAILAEGGFVVSNKEQLDTMFKGPKAVERMKDQIRYRNLIRGESITMRGNKTVLYERLLAHITKPK